MLRQNQVRQFVLLLLTLLLLLTASPVWAQPAAGFTPDKSDGCSPLTVTFTNTTTGVSPTATYTWNFGNGNSITTSNTSVPVAATYSSPQPYTVTLTVNDGGQLSIHQATINVHRNPSVNFTADNTSGCLPIKTTFTSTSSAGDGYITNYFWDFGDGNTLSSNQPTVSNTYAFPGKPSVNLTVTNSYGCISTFQRNNLMNVLQAVVPDFEADSTMVCDPASAILFSNASSGPGNLNYAWNFGDGSSSNSFSPSHRFPRKGTYTVSLTVTSSAGCFQKLVKEAYVNIADYRVDFQPTATVCSGKGIRFTDLSTPATTGTAIWSFGDGSTQKDSSLHTYVTPGNYTVTLTDSFGVCVSSLSKNIQVFPGIQATNFSMQKAAQCQAPLLVRFADNTPGAVQWNWNFTGNPGDVSTLQNPTFTYTTGDVYQPTLTVTDANGCSATFSRPINASGPTAFMVTDTTLQPSSTICATVTVHSRAVSEDPIVQYNWDFGDGATSTNATPVHSYTVPGTYLIHLNFVTSSGCRGTSSNTDTVRVWPKPKLDFTAFSPQVCGTLPTYFTNLSDTAENFSWNWGDGSGEVNNSDSLIHQYVFIGTYSITLTASSPGCSASLTKENFWTKDPPVPFFIPTNHCDGDRTVVDLFSALTFATHWDWDFGDGTTQSFDVETNLFQHTFPKRAGVYYVGMTLTNGRCTDFEGIHVYILPKQHPVLTATPPLLCGNARLQVRLSGLDTNYYAKDSLLGAYYNIVQWQYGDGTTFSPQGDSGFTTTYSGSLINLRPGRDSIRAIIQSKYFGCYDTSNYVPITISGPTIGLKVTDQLCRSTAVTLMDTAVVTGAPVVKWQWDFGDGVKATFAQNGDTVQHIYPFPGNYNTYLTVTDANGCSASANLSTRRIVVVGPKADFSWNPKLIVPGEPVTFTNSSINVKGASFQWFFYSDGAVSQSNSSVLHTYGAIVKDTVQLVATSKDGTCKDTSIQEVLVKNIDAGFTYTTEYINNSNCPPMVAYFKSTTTNIDSLHWDFGDGATAMNNLSPSHTYTLPGVYHVTMTAYGAGGLSIVTRDSITVKGPSAVLYTSLLIGCVPSVDTLHATTSYANGYTWDFGDGTVLNTIDTLAIHQYTLPGIYTPALVLTDVTGCKATFYLKEKILIDTLDVQLGPNDTLCTPGLVQFRPTLYSIAADSLQMPLTAHWNFGTGAAADTSSQLNTSFTFTRPGLYPAVLSVRAPSGCSRSATDTVLIVPYTPLQYPPEKTVCIGNGVPLEVSGRDEYQWAPDTTLTNILGGYALAAPQTNTTYTVIGLDKYHCFRDTAHIQVAVKQPPQVSIDSLLNITAGNSITLQPVGSADVVAWSWYPSSYLSCTSCPTPVTWPASPITYTVAVTNRNGCVAIDTIHITISCSSDALRIPNAFTPNHDGKNELFRPVTRGVSRIRAFRVYSRWGEVLYEWHGVYAEDSSMGWDGSFKGMPMDSGTYVYLVEAECYTGEILQRKGTVVLIR